MMSLNKFSIVVILFLISIFELFGQELKLDESDKKEKSFKVYSNLLFSHDQLPKRFNYESQILGYNGLSFAYRQVNEKSIVLQLEAKVNIEKSNKVDESFNRLDLHLRYELGKQLKKKLFKLIKVQIGGAARLFHISENIDSRSYNEFKVNKTESGLVFSFFTHLEYRLSKHFYIDINTPLLSVSTSIDTWSVDNPSLTAYQKKTRRF